MDIRRNLGSMTDIQRNLDGVTDIWRAMDGVIQTIRGRKLCGMIDIGENCVV